MADTKKLLAAIAKCDDPKVLRNWIKNARDNSAPEIEEAAFRKLISIVPGAQPGTVEYDFWQSVQAFELFRSDENGKTTRLSRTRQKVNRVGEVQTLIDWAISEKTTDGFDMLLERGMPELTGEAIVLRHPDVFDDEVRALASAKLKKAGVNLSTLPTIVCRE